MVVWSQDISRDPEVQTSYANDPLCVPIGTYKGVADMLLGVRSLRIFPPI